MESRSVWGMLALLQRGVSCVGVGIASLSSSAEPFRAMVVLDDSDGGNEREVRSTWLLSEGSDMEERAFLLEADERGRAGATVRGGGSIWVVRCVG